MCPLVMSYTLHRLYTIPLCCYYTSLCSIPKVRGSISEYSRLINEGAQKDRPAEDAGKWRGPIIELSIGSHVQNHSAIYSNDAFKDIIDCDKKSGGEGSNQRTLCNDVCYEELSPVALPLSRFIHDWHKQHISAQVEDLMLSEETMALGKGRRGDVVYAVCALMLQMEIAVLSCTMMCLLSDVWCGACSCSPRDEPSRRPFTPR